LESESEGGQKFLPPNPLPFCPPERSVLCSAKGGAIIRSFVQKRFELRSAIATNSDISNPYPRGRNFKISFFAVHRNLIYIIDITI